MLNLNARLHHQEEVLREVQEHKGCSLHELHVDHVVCRKFAQISLLERFSLVCSCGTVALSGYVGTARLALGPIWFFEDADVEAQEFARQEVLDHLVVVEQGFFLETDAALELAVLRLRNLPVLKISQY
jgi:hypothetical protein